MDIDLNGTFQPFNYRSENNPNPWYNQLLLSPSREMRCNWKEAATVILTAAKKEPEKGSWNYTVLTLKKNFKNNLKVNDCVFPGGTTETVDSDKNWLDLFSSFKIKFSAPQTSGWPVLPIIKNQIGDIPKLLTLKITAIRETFEETGILLCTRGDEKSSEDWISTCTFEDLNVWRAKVLENPSEFFNLCAHHKCCPDVSRLHLWSNWLTPTNLPKRFDTAFFTAFLKGQLDVVPDGVEISKSVWLTPVELLDLYKCQKIFFPPPQIYELGRLVQFKDITALKEFAKGRSEQGHERWMPLRLKTSDGLVTILPGDEAYFVTDCCAPTQLSEIKMSNEEYRSQFKILHRIEFTDNSKAKIISRNYKSPNGHVLPPSD